MKNTIELGAVMTLLRDNGVHYIGCYYSGAGDSGEIESIILFGPSFDECYANDNIQINFDELGDVDYDLPKDIAEFIENLFYTNHLNSIEDWYNNEGGYGSMAMCTKTGKFKNQNNQYHTDVITFNHEGQIQID